MHVWTVRPPKTEAVHVPLFWQAQVPNTPRQVGPANPDGQVQVKPVVPTLVQIPPAKHGFEEHGLPATAWVLQFVPVTPAEQWH